MKKKSEETSKLSGRSSTLSIRLMNKGASVKDGLRSGHTMIERESEGGYLYTAQSEDAPPSWVKIVREFSIEDLPDLTNRHCSAVLFLEVTPSDLRMSKRFFAITFGSGHLFLNPDSYVKNFGLRVTLNAVARSDLRNVDVAQLDTTLIQKRIQASRKSDLRDFGIDEQSDLLRLAGGAPTDREFARALVGKDALSLTAKIDPAKIADKCREAFDLYCEKHYERDFKFIDYIVPENRQSVVKVLDKKVFDSLKSMVDGRSSSLHIAIPEMINPEDAFEIGYYGSGLRSGSKATYPDVEIEDYVSELRSGRMADIADMSELKASHEIRVIVNGEGDKRQRQRLYDCFIFEAKYGGATYVLFAGSWYRIDSGYYARVVSNFEKYLSKKPFVKSTNSVNERDFIGELNARKELLNLDQVKLSPLNASGANLEPCDFFSKSRQFIHLKDGHDSAPISHLWNQGLVSAECLVSDGEFRQQLRDNVQIRQIKYGRAGFVKLLPRKGDQTVTASYSVVYGIMRTAYVSKKARSKGLDLPFFSKVSFQPIAERIGRMGFKVEVHLIEKKRK
ncbi:MULTISPECIES: DUF6119 family protein [Burkholderia]|uniref:DUF6119 family protein n=1 Tax=Burkholderia TaxID=32008 RepID=UPI001959A117|nr:DUF6119 family protein [Burkholderia sp. MS389]CAG2346629.1 hypothetical protein BCCR75389_05403 [Burkholderia cenocepacia]CAG2346829.1 hypothetical protein BCCR75388_05430 [Burkholderia cenocepacia]CAG2346859.1 hypothetical protein BCCR75384_05430 [Burkholderia cenocepacia]CAG2346992.1 hypothetical protein BCCR75387_05427 [Burkholderia cenocepacia]CAG2347004.1 hypothetical protein BCCR75386_05430 [Burkholderia cenocepacia]